MNKQKNWCMLLLVNPLLCFGTSIVVVVTPSQVFIGADSKAVIQGTFSKEVCKIHVSKNIAFAFTGFADSDHFKFHAAELADKSVSEGGTLTEITNRFIERVALPLTEAVKMLYMTDRIGYDRDFRGKPLLETIFATSTPVPEVRYIRFDLRETPQGPMAETAKEQIVLPKQARFLAIGKTDAIMKYIEEHGLNDSIWQNDPVGFIKIFLQQEIFWEQKTVGLPISILEVRPNDMKWIEAGKCEGKDK